MSIRKVKKGSATIYELLDDKGNVVASSFNYSLLSSQMRNKLDGKRS